jgi:hypothetical protein
LSVAIESERAAGSESLRWLIRASSAVFGFSLAVGLAPKLALRARPSEMISALKAAGLSPTGLILQFLTAVLLTAAFAMIGERISRFLSEYRWAAISYSAALLLAPVALMSYGNFRHVLLMGIVAAAIVFLRKRDPHFSRGDVIQIPILLACYMAVLDIDFGHTAIATFLRAAIVVFALRLIIRSADAFVLAPLALIFETRLQPPQIGAALALLVIIATPFILWRTRVRIARRIVYPIVVFLYPLAALQIPSPIFAPNFFEDSHDVTVASEMMRGERPYTDIVPTHGLINDGIVYYVAMKLGHDGLRDLLNVRVVVGTVSGVAIYCLVLAATGVLDMALLAAFLTLLLSPGVSIWLRPSGAIFALAAAVAGTRLRSRRWFVIAGALVVLAYLISIDFGIYSAIVVLFAAFRARSLRWFALGVAAAAVPVLLLFAAFGFALDFLRVNAQFLGGHSSYFMRPLEIPEQLRSPSLINHLAEGLQPIVWVVALVATCAALAQSPFRARRSDAPWLIGVWMIVATASFIERGNPYFNVVLTPFLFVALWTLHRHARTLATVLIVVVVLLGEPFRHVISVIPELRAAKVGPLFNPMVTTSIRASQRFVATLKPDETFVDFANSALLYALLKRDCPLRQVEVANYQSVEAQHDVIERIRRNPKIRAALIVFPGSDQRVDGITNADRAPLVWSFLQQNFTPAFAEDGVVFWRRIR